MRKQNCTTLRPAYDSKTLPIAICYLCLPSNLLDNSEVFVTSLCPTKVAGAGFLLAMERL
jgi:hypothetical protein